MRPIPLSQLEVGVRIARDVLTGREHEVPLLRAGVVVRSGHVRRLAAAGVHAVWVQDELSEGLAPPVAADAALRARAQGRVQASFEAIRHDIERGGALPPEALETFREVARTLVRQLVDVPVGALMLQDLAAADAYTHRHSVQVAVLGILIARHHWSAYGWEDWDGSRRDDEMDARLELLGTGLLLHDVGKLAVPMAVLQKPGRLTPWEFDLMREHPAAGAALLADARPSALVMATVRDHHERLDGSGYPDGKREIHEFAQLCAIADVYDAITSARSYKPAAPAHVAVDVLSRAGVEGQLDPRLVRTFRAVCAPFPVGAWVEPAEDVRGVVTEVDPVDPWIVTLRRRAGLRTVEAVHDLRALDGHRAFYAGDDEPGAGVEEVRAARRPREARRPA